MVNVLEEGSSSFCGDVGCEVKQGKEDNESGRVRTGENGA